MSGFKFMTIAAVQIQYVHLNKYWFSPQLFLYVVSIIFSWLFKMNSAIEIKSQEISAHTFSLCTG